MVRLQRGWGIVTLLLSTIALGNGYRVGLPDLVWREQDELAWFVETKIGWL